MNAFVVITSKRGAPIPRALLRSLAKPDLPDVPFRPDAHLLWTNARGTVAYVGWQAATWRAGIGSHWHVDEDALTAWSGQVWPRGSAWPRSGSWAAGLADLYRRRGPLDCLGDLVGDYSACRLSRDDDGIVLTDPWGVGMVCMAEDADVVAVSNRATLAARAVSRGSVLHRDPLGAGWLPFAGYIVGGATGLCGVRVIPQGAYVRIDRSGRTEVRQWSRAIWMDEEDAVPREELLRRVRDELVGNVACFTQTPADEFMVSLSGGKDMRLVLALLLAAGVTGSMRFSTTGTPDHPDVVVARELAVRFGLDHRVDEPEPLAMDAGGLLDSVRADAYTFSGMLGCWDLKRRGFAPPSGALWVGGLFGEVLRTFYSKNRVLGSWEEVERFFCRGRFDPAAIVRPEARDAYLGEVRAWVAEQRDVGASPEDVPDLFYLHHRLPRWFGAEQQLTPWLTGCPLQTLEGLRAAFRLGLRSRQTDDLHFTLTRELVPELSKMALANDTWHQDNWGHLADADEYRRAAPRTAPADSGAPIWQLTAYPKVCRLLEEYVLADPSNPVLEVVDRIALEGVLRAEGTPPAWKVERLYGVLTAAVWLAGDELVKRCGEEGVAREARRPADILPVRIRGRIDRARREDVRREARKARAARPPSRRVLRARLRRVPVLGRVVRGLRVLRGTTRDPGRRRVE
ncbi:MAG: hypothetical protein HY775_05390 [Acidobacteria bacterium]|nr:hypothetical protein [Acidobacteriota bacterium]